jgi:two-component system sensor histidine kinase QseC
LTVWLLVGLGLLLTAGGLVLNRTITSHLLGEYDEALIAEARSLETLTEERGGKVWLEFADEVMPEFEREKNPDYFQLWLRNGPVLERSESLGTRDLPRSGGPLDRPRLSDLTLPDGRHGRRVEISFHPQPEEEGEGEGPRRARSAAAGAGPVATLTVAQGREELDALLEAVQLTLVLVVLGLLGGTALLVKTVVGLALSPLDNLARQLEGLDADSLGRQAPEVAGAPAELVPVIHHLNGLLARLDASFARERAFSANLAHELRTPLAELRAMTEVALKWPGEASSALEALEEIHGIGLQMESVVVNLLALARSETQGRASEVPLRELAASCWAAVSPEAAAKGMAFHLEVPDGLTLVTDREKLALILSNLFANAVAYGSPGRPVTCSAAAAGDGFALGVRNATADLAPEDLPRLFDRFWRKDAARSDGRHTGLGLALVAALCESLKLQKEARLEGDCFEITLSSSSFLHRTVARVEGSR